MRPQHRPIRLATYHHAGIHARRVHELLQNVDGAVFTGSAKNPALCGGVLVFSLAVELSSPPPTQLCCGRCRRASCTSELREPDVHMMFCNGRGHISIAGFHQQFSTGIECDVCEFARECAAESISQCTIPSFGFDSSCDNFQIDVIDVFRDNRPSGTSATHFE